MCLLRGERSISVPQQHTDRFVFLIRNKDIRFSVTVQITQRHTARFTPRCIGHLCLKRTVSVSQQYADGACRSDCCVGHHEVRNAVAIHIADGNRFRTTAHIKRLMIQIGGGTAWIHQTLAREITNGPVVHKVQAQSSRAGDSSNRHLKIPVVSTVRDSHCCGSHAACPDDRKIGCINPGDSLTEGDVKLDASTERNV